MSDRRHIMADGKIPGLLRAFTLVELLVSITIIGTLLAISSLAFHKTIETSALAQARSSIATYAAVARSYAIANRVETLFVVNPYNGRFEVWYLNAPAAGGPFDPLSAGTVPPFTDGYAFAPVLDSAARLPVTGAGVPITTVNPIDFDDPINRPLDANTGEPSTSMDNLTWAALCFDPDGQLVIHTRRIATRSYHLRSGAIRTPTTLINRLIDESPDMSIRDTGGVMVMGGPTGDSAITSTRGFVISDLGKMRVALSAGAPNSQNLVALWLRYTRENQSAATGTSFASFSTTILFNRFSGQEASRIF